MTRALFICQVQNSELLHIFQPFLCTELHIGFIVVLSVFALSLLSITVCWEYLPRSFRISDHIRYCFLFGCLVSM
uniref:Uncharacterized protein n=1 Tax=Arundo donax TaxID=35708 RepID=A0A0A8ZWA4_ARUDO